VAVLTLRQRAVKRGFDIAASALSLLLLGPSMLVIAVAVRSEMGRPVIYRQLRVGRGGRQFRMPKFRSMLKTESMAVGSISVAGDPRVTPLGLFLRRSKLDELPQLWSVLTGDMSMVGPRPDVPGYADRLVGRDRRILSIRPGITSPATIRFRDEEALLGEQEDPERFNDEVLFPAKTRLNVTYLEAWSFRLDIACLLATLHPAFERSLPAWARRDEILDARRWPQDRNAGADGPRLG
jgi:lipopolysaccharide/colanic/teichoic acid biosynthesis glycosyltransferase